VPASTDLRFDTGRICLDLLATEGARLSAAPVERLDGTARLDQWLHRTGVLPEQEPLTGDTDTLLAEFHALRALLHRIVHTELDGGRASAADLERLNRFAEPGPPALRLERADDGRLHRRLAGPVRPEQLLAAVADDAVRLLGSAERELMRECEGPTCDMVYLDTSRGRRRRWCSAAVCGNRHHVAAHRARKAGQT
jgi:predicted RNA-binding Zn ribbon-like protein